MSLLNTNLVTAIRQCCIPKFGLQCRFLIYSSIKDIYLSSDTAGCKAEIQGWVRAVRKMKEKTFIDLDDGTWPTKLQLFIPTEDIPQGLSFGSSIKTSGELVNNPKSKQIELVVSDINVIGPCVVTDGYPFAPRKTYPPEYVRKYIHLRPRTRAFSSLLRVRHSATLALNQFFNEAGFFKIDVPVLTTNDCEGAGEIFTVKPDSQKLIEEMGSPNITPEEAFFSGKTFLTVSGQLHLEAAVRSLGKVYCFGPTFRAENSKSRLHLSEFYMVEAELAFTKSLDSVLNIIEGLIKGMCHKLMDNAAEDLHMYVKCQDVNNSLNIEHLLSSAFTVDSYDSVCDILNSHSDQFVRPLRKGESFTKEHELFLVKHNNNVPIFVIDWPAKIKPFYMKADDKDPSKVHAVDLLCSNIGELCGGSLREDDYDTLETKLKLNNLHDKLGWYLELRKFGNVPTGGFGMGFERFLQLILGIPNIKDAIPFPRWPHNCKL